MRDKPTETGIYWARRSYSTGWDHIIKIQGESPFFTYIGWNLNYPGRKSEEATGLIGTNPIDFIFGDKVLKDYDCSNKIDIPKQQGLYWVVVKPGKYSSEIVLAYIEGKAPYMSCFIWDFTTNSRKRVLSFSPLSFLKRIDEPLILIQK